MNWSILEWDPQDLRMANMQLFPLCCQCCDWIDTVGELQILLESFADEDIPKAPGSVIYLHRRCCEDYFRDKQKGGLIDPFLTEDERRAGQPLPEVSLARFALHILRWIMEPRLGALHAEIDAITSPFERLEQLTRFVGEARAPKAAPEPSPSEA